MREVPTPYVFFILLSGELRINISPYVGCGVTYMYFAASYRFHISLLGFVYDPQERVCDLP